MISFALEEDQQLVRETAHGFARDVIRPNCRGWERAGAVPQTARRRFHELGLLLIGIPEALGGGGGSMVTAAIVHEELAWGDAATAMALWSPHLAAIAIHELAEPAQARDLLSCLSGPDALGAVAYSERVAPLVGFGTVARKRGSEWVLYGEKCFVVNGGQAELTLVFAQLDIERGWEGVGVFVLPRETPGMRPGTRHELLGLDTVPITPVVFDGCVLPDSARLHGRDQLAVAIQRFFARGALVNAARQVGLARAAYEYALGYTEERHAFGKPVAHFQAIAFTLADMHMDVESARWLVWRAAHTLDRGEPDYALVAAAGVHANEAAWRVADHAVQLLGGAGYIQDHPVEKWLRDTKTLALCTSPTELERLVIAARELGPGFGEPWPSLALQTGIF